MGPSTIEQNVPWTVGGAASSLALPVRLCMSLPQPSEQQNNHPVRCVHDSNTAQGADA